MYHIFNTCHAWTSRLSNLIRFASAPPSIPGLLSGPRCPEPHTWEARIHLAVTVLLLAYLRYCCPGPLENIWQQSERKRDTVSFIWIWLIFILNSLCLKSSLQVNLSPSSTSLPLGLFVSTLALPQANDWSVRRNSPSSANRRRQFNISRANR